MATNGGAHRFNKTIIIGSIRTLNLNRDVVVSSISILGQDSPSAFAQTHPLRFPR